MGLMDKIRGKGPGYDSSDIRVTDIDYGFMFDYDLSTWEVVDVYLYDWGDNNISKEFKISNESESAFLSVEDDGELSISISKEVPVRLIDENIPEHIRENEEPPATLEYEGKKFLLEGEYPGYFKEPRVKNAKWTEFISWSYYDEDEEYLITIEQWEEKQFNASFGKYIEEFEISNILPKSE